MIVGTILAILLLFVIVTINLLLFFVYESHQSKKGTKHAIGKFIAFIFVAVVLIHLGCLIYTAYQAYVASGEEAFTNILEGFRVGITELYSGFGTLTFGAQYFDGDLIVRLFYFGSSAVLAITDALLIAMGVSYEFRCAITLRFVMLFGLPKGRQIFIFTTLSKESLTLADSLNEHYDRPLIIFAGDTIAPFDRNDADCQNVRGKRYFYFSMRAIPNAEELTKKGKKVYLLKRVFGARIQNVFQFLLKHKVCIFALAGQGNKGDEAKNLDVVFDDIRAIAPSLHKEFMSFIMKKGFLTTIDRYRKQYFLEIDYYLLSNNNINFEFYHRKLDSCLNEVFSSPDFGQNSAFRSIFDIFVLNESILAAEDMLAKRHRSLIENEDLISGEAGDTHKALAIGFGLDGQTAASHLYSDCGKAKLDGYRLLPQRFECEAVDRNFDTLIGKFLGQHPSFVMNPPVDGKDTYAQLKRIYEGYDFETLNHYLGFPVVSGQQIDYKSLDFLRYVRRIVDRTFDSVVIALGDDERNIECANQILMAIRQLPNKNDHPVRIYVNLYNSDNNSRLNWQGEIDRLVQNNVFVYPFGNSRDLYSWHLLDFEGSAEIDLAYRLADSTQSSSDVSHSKCLHGYRALSYYSKICNAAALEFGKLYCAYLSSLDDETLKALDEDYHQFLAIKKLGKNAYMEAKEVTPTRAKLVLSDQALQRNIIKAAYKEKDYIPCSFSNYVRVMTKMEEGYFARAGKHWRFMAQFDHNRWMKHAMHYGRAFGKDAPTFFDPTAEDSDNALETRSAKYYRHVFKLDYRLLPWSNMEGIYEGRVPKLLPYAEEDYDFAIILSSIRYNKKEFPRISGLFE